MRDPHEQVKTETKARSSEEELDFSISRQIGNGQILSDRRDHQRQAIKWGGGGENFRDYCLVEGMICKLEG